MNERTWDRENVYMNEQKKYALKNVGLDIYVDPNEKSFSFN